MKSAILLEVGDIKVFSRCSYALGAAATRPRIFQDMLPKVG